MTSNILPSTTVTSNTCFTGVLGRANFDPQRSNQRERVTPVPPAVPCRVTDLYCVVHGGMLGCWHGGDGTRGCARRAGLVSQRTQPLHRKKTHPNQTKNLQKWYRVTGRVLCCSGLSVISTQLHSYVLLSHDCNPCIDVRYRV